ncbi:hypothetical protein LZX53_002144 [Salmonella enterica]|uniref:Uncharacterized protein n=4 Tax=Salmonella enterica TaxID=28901 RepID=A0A5U8K844_SALEB|nr:hypothetical protein [Salmonella enterica]EAA1980639.1 hypothetical protein [Salmonella enterica subsp. enterica serovar Java]EBH7930705.1 hypothetical protein [Salmonella enterica subsp. enterica serovar Rubislaw]EBM9946944.1 hypothetical protein [Salmonella enterica subsp. enterica serovar Give]EBP3334729.1 hypothetical protein [Salmonella enterica subsp. enterica]EBV1873368.1 hypothetical protein [Salmonella enterica subsp. enterica serovar Adelaide]EBW8396620.1 hypothetical protein [Sa
MNNERRKHLAVLSQQLAELKDDVQSVPDEEEDAFNNLPEGIQNGERGDAMQTAIAALDAAVSALEEASDQLTEAQT